MEPKIDFGYFLSDELGEDFVDNVGERTVLFEELFIENCEDNVHQVDVLIDG